MRRLCTCTCLLFVLQGDTETYKAHIAEQCAATQSEVEQVTAVLYSTIGFQLGVLV